ncbi:hypothetical protein [Stenotrophomonas sp. NPDC077659]|uniref:hypothetical protein n=1 Tax=Stenotrophomonas sp. NPDC077659 TaxID=3390694 RepID=UPI003D087CE6
MPVFALVLRIAYIPRAMGYLEHLVVALYSYCWLMLVALATVLVTSISNALASPLVSTLGLWITALQWLAVPVYLLWMRQPVSGGNKLLTVLRYALIGGVYFFLVNVLVMYTAQAGISA